MSLLIRQIYLNIMLKKKLKKSQKILNKKRKWGATLAGKY